LLYVAKAIELSYEYCIVLRFFRFLDFDGWAPFEVRNNVRSLEETSLNHSTKDESDFAALQALGRRLPGVISIRLESVIDLFDKTSHVVFESKRAKIFSCPEKSKRHIDTDINSKWTTPY